jgi:ribosomal-protein-alanine N-acetyltransferase
MALRSHLSADYTLSLVCEDGTGVFGCLLLSCLSPEGEVLSIGVLPRARRRGAGRLLLEKGMEMLKSRGACVLYLDVRVSNTPARALYSALGFREVGRRRDFYVAPREDALLMEREID